MTLNRIHFKVNARSRDPNRTRILSPLKLTSRVTHKPNINGNERKCKIDMSEMINTESRTTPAVFLLCWSALLAVARSPPSPRLPHSLSRVRRGGRLLVQPRHGHGPQFLPIAARCFPFGGRARLLEDSVCVGGKFNGFRKQDTYNKVSLSLKKRQVARVRATHQTKRTELNKPRLTLPLVVLPRRYARHLLYDTSRQGVTKCTRCVEQKFCAGSELQKGRQSEK